MSGMFKNLSSLISDAKLLKVRFGIFFDLHKSETMKLNSIVTALELGNAYRELGEVIGRLESAERIFKDEYERLGKNKK